MDSTALFGYANWKLNMNRQELIKPDLNPPYTRLCEKEIKPTAKQFGEDLSKRLKEMSIVKRAGQQMQKATKDSAYTKKARAPMHQGGSLMTDLQIVWIHSNAVLFLVHGRATTHQTKVNKTLPKFQ